MGNTKTFYIEGELRDHAMTREQLREAISNAFHQSYLALEFVEEKGGYLGGSPSGGPYVVAAVHSYSMKGGIDEILPLFVEFRCHRVDYDWADCRITLHDEKHGTRSWVAHDSKWKDLPTLETIPEGGIH